MARHLTVHVHNAWPLGTLFEAGQELCLGIRKVLHRCDVQLQVGSVEAGVHNVVRADRELRRNPLQHCLVGGCGQQHHLLDPKLPPHQPQLEVVWPEVVTPLRDAVGLVNGQQADRVRAHGGQEALSRCLLRGHVQHFENSLGHLLAQLVPLVVGRLRAPGSSLHPTGPEGIHLVFHQTEQGRDDQAQPLGQQGRQLVAQRLPLPRGEHAHN
mmetsp:Transcript_111437/g.193362  ORF Transcript_111437/g.193362 Transcript_111437/m.193362 type:complete len:212 (-) Transcript_111437:632-1267(-)